MPSCPSCDEHDLTVLEPMDDGRWLCPVCNVAWLPKPPPRLVDLEPRRRRDTDE